MSDQPVSFNTFRGLNLRDAPDSVGDQCIDALNVTLDRTGTKVRSRDGYANLTSSATTDACSFLFRQDDSKLLVATAGGATPRFQSIDSSGTITALANEAVYSAVNFGTPSASYTYCASGTTSPLRRVSGTTVTSPAGMPSTGWLGLQETDNRLVVGGPSSGPAAASSSAHHVWFSDAGNAESWGANNYVQLTPGDGESIRQVVSWRGQVFVFKQTRMFVFYGNSTDASGNPVFNFRAVKLPSSVVTGKYVTQGSPGQIATAGEDGVYFITSDGVYVTTGDVPTLLSEDLYPLGTDDALPATFTGSDGRWVNAIAIHFHKRRLFVSVEGPTTSGTWVHDLDSGTWLPWNIHPSAFATWEAEDRGGLLYFVGGTTSHLVYRFKSSFTTDAGANISSYYRTGFYDLGDGDQKTIHNVDIWGTGTINYSSARDFNATMGTARSVTLGTSPAIGYGRTQPSADTARGNLFSHKFADSSGGAWSVHRVVQNIQAKRPSGPKGT